MTAVRSDKSVEVSTSDELDGVRPLGVVPTEGRGSLPFALLHNESLVAVASWALTEAEVELLDFDASWVGVQSRHTMLVVHDPLCPATPVSFLRRAIETAAASHAVVVGVRPVTDTVKELDGEVVGETVPRADLVAVVSPVVLPAGVVTELDAWPSLDDLAELVSSLRVQYPVTFLEAPAFARRVVDDSDLRLLEALPE